jgi:hypothetical protein
MSADNGVYILRTPTDDGYEYRVSELGAVENVYWDNERSNFSRSEDVAITNARQMWKGCSPFTKEGEALEYAAEILRQLPICEYGISFVEINRRF